MRLRRSDVKQALSLKSNTAIGRLLPPKASGKAYTKWDVCRWGELIPELESRRLIDLHPVLRDHVVDPATGLTVAQMREKVMAES